MASFRRETGIACSQSAVEGEGEDGEVGGVDAGEAGGLAVGGGWLDIALKPDRAGYNAIMTPADDIQGPTALWTHRAWVWFPWVAMLVMLSVFIGWFHPNSTADISDLKIVIQGDARYTSWIKQALGLLKAKAPEAYTMVNTHLGVIRDADRSGVHMELDPPIYDLKAGSAYYSLTWCAAVIAHDAYHAKSYHEHVSRHGAPLPKGVWVQVDEELAANAYQVEVMRLIGAPSNELDHMAHQDGTHFDANKDGRYTEEDYLQNDW